MLMTVCVSLWQKEEHDLVMHICNPSTEKTVVVGSQIGGLCSFYGDTMFRI